MSIVKTRTQIPIPRDGQEVIFRTTNGHTWAGTFSRNKFCTVNHNMNTLTDVPPEDVTAWIDAGDAFRFCELNNA